MFVVPLVLAPVVLTAAGLVERRLGSSAAGWVVSLPVVVAIAVASVDRDAGARAAAGLALSAASHVAAQVVLALAAATVLLRRGIVLGVLAGLTGYVVVSLLAAELPAVASVLLAVGLLAAGPGLMPRLPGPTPGARAWWTTALSCLSATIVVAAAILGSRLAGPHLAGALTAFPGVSLTLAVAVGGREGRQAGVRVLVGLVRGLPSYLAFCLVVALAAPRAGLASVPLGLLAALATASLTWRGVTAPPTRGSALVGARRRSPRTVGPATRHTVSDGRGG